MAKQLEDGYTKIINEILDKFINTSFSGQELRIILFIIRKTWGFNKTEDYIALSKMEEATGISKIRCSQIVNSLQLMKILTVTENINGKTKKYKFNKYFENWQTVNKNINRLKKVKQPLIKTLTLPLIKNESTKEKNINKITKENIYSVILTKINSIGKEKGILKRDLRQITHIRARHNDGYSEDDILLACKNCFDSDWHIENGKATDLEYVLRKSKIDGHINMKSKQKIDPYDEWERKYHSGK